MAVYLSLSVSQGTPNTTSRTNTVTATVTVHYSGGSYNGNSPSGTLTINNQNFNFTCNFNYAGVGQGAASTGSGSVTACTKTVTVPYETSGTKTVYCYASFASGTASGTVTANQSITLTPISSSEGSGGNDGDDGDDDDSGSETPTPLTGNCTVVGQTWSYFEKESLDYYYTGSDFNLTNYDYMPQYSVVKFTTPSFVGTSTSLSVNLSGTKADFTIQSYPICFALCSSDANHNMYLRGASVVYDSNQIASGTLSRDKWTSMPFSIQTDKLNPDTDYYLIFWIPSDIGFDAFAEAAEAQYHGITVNYTTKYLFVKHAENASITIYKYYEDGDAYIDESENCYDIYDDDGLWRVYEMSPDDHFRFNIETSTGYTLVETHMSGLQYNDSYCDYWFNPNFKDEVRLWVTIMEDSHRVLIGADSSGFKEYICYIDTEIVSHPKIVTECDIIGHGKCTGYIDMNTINSNSDYVLNQSSEWGCWDFISSVYKLKFTTRNFIGTSTSIKFNIGTSGKRDGVDDTNTLMNYALCTSDINCERYAVTFGIPEDEYCIASGTFDEVTNGVSVIKINNIQLEPNTEYYLFVWDAQSSVDVTIIKSIEEDCHSIVVTSDDTSTTIHSIEFKPYCIYIDNGENWELFSNAE